MDCTVNVCRYNRAILAVLTLPLMSIACGHSGDPNGQSQSPTGLTPSTLQADPPNLADINGNGTRDADASDTDWPGKMTVVYEDATTADAIRGREVMEQYDMLQQFADDINSTLKLPYDIPIQGKQCDESSLYWSPGDKAVVLCYEGVSHLVDQFTELGDDIPEDAVYDTELLGFFHESGHMVIDIYDLPAVGREEDDADQVSAYLMLQPNPDGSVDRDRLDSITDAARSFAADAAAQGGVDDTDLADVHSPTKARMYNLECWAYGADPAYGADLVSAGLLPQDRADGCEEEYAKLRSAWDRLLEPYLK
jgi:hypothetical protein